MHLRGVHGVRAREVDGVDVARGEQRVEALRDVGGADAVGELPRASRVSRRDPTELDAVDRADRVRETLGDGTGPDDADADHPPIMAATSCVFVHVVRESSR